MTGKKLATVFGIVFVVVGLLGFIGGLGIVGPEGIFTTDTTHDLIHLISGIVFLIVAAKAPQNSSATLMIFGVVYGLVAVLGLLSGDGHTHVAGILMNENDDYLHIVLALATFIGGFATRPKNTMM